MPCSYQVQYISVSASQPGTAWRSDVILETPTLVSPLSGDNICAEGVVLVWEAVPDADFYVVQWCLASTFAGPTIRSAKTAGLTITLDLDDLPLETKIYWRVFAYNDEGGVSGKSEAWEVTKTCPDNPGDPDGSPLAADFSKCVESGVKISVDGPKWVMCCDLAMWHLQATWSHLDGAGNQILRLDDVVWTVVQDPNDPNNVIKQSNEKFCVVEINCNASQVFKLRCQVFFTDLRNSTQFACTDEVKVFVDCRTGLPNYKPWLGFDFGFGLSFYTHPDYRDVSMGEHQFPEIGDWVDVYGADPSTIESTTSGPTALGPAQWGGEDRKQAISWGPVAMTGMEEIPRPDQTVGRCGIDPGPTHGERLEARTHIPLGCGLRVTDRRISIDYEDLIGSGSARRGLVRGDGCGIGVYYGCGLTLDEYGRLVFDAASVAGTGLTTEGDCGLAVYYGCGLTINEAGRLAFDASSVAGPGLQSDGECGLQIYYGCGLTLDDAGRLMFDAESVIGGGLRVVGECGLAVYYGCGLTIDEAGRLAFDAAAVAGPGLSVYNDCGLQVDVADCGGLGVDNQGQLLVESDSSALSRTIWSLDPQSVVLSVSGCSVTLGMTVTPFLFYMNCGGVLLGPILEGPSVSISRYISLYYCCPSCV